MEALKLDPFTRALSINFGGSTLAMCFASIAPAGISAVNRILGNNFLTPGAPVGFSMGDDAGGFIYDDPQAPGAPFLTKPPVVTGDPKLLVKSDYTGWFYGQQDDLRGIMVFNMSKMKPKKTFSLRIHLSDNAAFSLFYTFTLVIARGVTDIDFPAHYKASKVLNEIVVPITVPPSGLPVGKTLQWVFATGGAQSLTLG